jgi:hypothetical protein
MAFTKPTTGDTVAHTDITQIIESLDGTAASGEPIKITKVNDAANYALDVMNLDPVHGYALRVRDSSGNVLLTLANGGGTLSQNLTLGAGVTIDGIDPGAHGHTGLSGDAPQIQEAGLANGAVTTDKLYPGAVTATKIAAAAITGDRIANSTIAEANLAFEAATQAELDAHAATSAVHGLGSGVYVLGTKAAEACRIEAKAGSQSVAEAGEFTITVVWDTAFATAIVAAASAFGSDDTSGNMIVTQVKGISISSTGASHTFTAGSGDEATDFIEDWLALGY